MSTRVLRNRSQRQKLVAEFRAGGLGNHAFCKLHGIASSTLDAWLRESEKASAFVPVRIESTEILPSREGGGDGVSSFAAAARLIGTRGAVLEFSAGAQPAWVAEICGRLM